MTNINDLAQAMGLRHARGVYTDGDMQREAVVEYGFDLKFANSTNQDPHFSVTVSHAGGGGADHEFIAKHFPKIAPFLRWHLTSTGEPMHYAANGTYWYLMAHNRGMWRRQSYDPDPIKAFCSTILFGTADGDDAFDPSVDPVVSFGLEPEEGQEMVSDEQVEKALRAWLSCRFDTMMSTFVRDMETLYALQSVV